MLLELDERPFSIYGQCSGALLGYELAHYLSTAGRAPAHFFAAASSTPFRYNAALLEGFFEDKRADALGEGPLLSFLRWVEFQGLAELDRDPELRELALGTIRSDSQMLLAYKPRPRPPLEVPITCIGGGRDPTTNPYELWQWARETSRRFDWRWLPSANHFFHLDHEGEIAALLEHQLRSKEPPAVQPPAASLLPPEALVQTLYAAYRDAEACSEFVLPDANWRVHGPGTRELGGLSLWFTDPRVGLDSIVHEHLTIVRAGDSEHEVLARSPLRLSDGSTVEHRARYEVREGKILSGEIDIG